MNTATKVSKKKCLHNTTPVPTPERIGKPMSIFEIAQLIVFQQFNTQTKIP